MNHLQPVAPESASPKPALKPWFRASDGSICLYCGDALAILDQLSADSVDMIFADPPYRLSNDGFTCHAGRRVSVNKGNWDRSEGFVADTRFHEEWIRGCRRVLKPGGTLWISGTAHSIYQCGYLLMKLDFHLLNDIAWFKPNAAPNLSCSVFAHSHETLLWARKSKTAKNTFNYAAMKKGHFPEDRIKAPNKQMRSVWSIPTPPASEKKFGKHPTQKPLALLKRIVQSSTKEGDVILDPFNGSGTTALACQLIGARQCIGIELKEEYLGLTLKRIRTLPIEERSFQTTSEQRGVIDLRRRFSKNME